MSQSVREKISQVLPTEEVDDRNKPKVIKNGLLIVTGKFLVFKGTLYQLKNIASIQFTDNTQVYTKKTPILYWIILGVGIVTIYLIIGIFITIAAIWLLYKHYQSRTKIKEEYGLEIIMNSGYRTVLLSKKEDFVLDVLQGIYERIDIEDPQPITFDFGNYSIDQSIKVDKSIIKSSLISGEVVGNVSS
jgi:hypothetical protein